MVRRFTIFYDGNFFLHCSNYYMYAQGIRKRLSLGGLHRFFLHKVADSLGYEIRDCRLSESHYYRGRLNAQDAAQRNNQLYNDRVFEDIMISEGITTHYLPLRNSGGRREESGTNVALSLGALEMAMNDSMDVAVLIVADTDYTPLMRKLASYNVRTVVAGWDFEYTTDESNRMTTKTSQELRQLADLSLAMTDIIDEGLKNNDPLVTSIFVGNDQ